MTIAPHTQLDHYEILSPLGKGGMGEVYLAHDARLSRNVALKLLPAEFTQSPDRVRRFEHEAKAASALNHPNILTIYEIGVTDHTHFIATEYIEGETLRQCLSREKLSLNAALEIATQMASALAAAHDAKIIHRDIKPENVMLRKDGIVKVLDFGLAKLTEKQPTSSHDSEAPTLIQHTTDAGTVMGTASYMSPEQARGEKVDARSDLFSLGIVLYEMLAGQRPFEGANMLDIVGAVLHQEPKPLPSNNEAAQPELQRIVSKALQKDREQRYQTSKDLLLDLQTLKHELEIEARLKGRDASNEVAQTVSLRPNPTDQLQDNHTSSSTQIILTELKRHKLGVALTLLLLLAVGSYFAFFARSNNAPIDSLAILPFTNASGDPEMEYLSDGLTESLINSLAQLPRLRVLPRTTVFRFKGKAEDPQRIGKELGVRAVLTGRVQQRGDSLVIQTELIDVTGGAQLWGDRYNPKLANLLAAQSEVVQAIAGGMRLKLSGAEQSRVSKKYTESAEAYQLYLKGRFHWNKRTGETLKKAIEYFNQAIEHDPRYALAYAGLADAYMVMHFHAGVAPNESYGKAKSAARQALALDETLAEAHTALAYVLFRYDWKPAEAFREFQRAIELNPNYATTHQWYGESLTLAGRFDEGIAELRRAQELDPFSLVINTDLGNACYYARRYDAAIEQLHKTLELDQGFAYTHYNLGLAYTMKGMYPAALAEFRLTQQLNNGPYLLANLAYVYAASGQHAEALRLLNQMQEIAKQRYVPAYSFALAYAGLGEREQSLQWLERSYQDRSSDMTYVKTEPRFDSLRSDPHFAALVRRVGLPE